ncbi:MAG: four helix bundle protein [Flavobacteriales bacterium]|nr:four helix bundle protein [Flavobacteriales bacterium]
MATITHFRDLQCWQKCREVRQRVRILVKRWPGEEKFRLTDQIIRSSRGPTSHIAEGYGRFYEKENIRFCRIARGSLYETQDHLITANDDGFIDEDVLKEHFEHVETAIRILNGYLRYLDTLSAPRSSSVSEPPAPYDAQASVVRSPPSPEAPLNADL